MKYKHSGPMLCLPVHLLSIRIQKMACLREQFLKKLRPNYLYNMDLQFSIQNVCLY